MLSKLDKRIKSILTKYELVNEAKLNGIEAGDGEGKSLVAEMIERGIVTGDDILTVLAMESRFPPIRISQLELDESASAALSQELAKYYKALPISKVGNVMTIAVADPFDLPKLDEIAIISNCEIRPVVALEKDIEEGIERLYSPEEAKLKDILEQAGSTHGLEVKEEKESEIDITQEVELPGEDSQVVKLVNTLLVQAVRERASDIHIEPFDKSTIVRMRIDGSLREKTRFPITMHPSVTTRIKVMSSLNIAERRIPQDGKFQMKYEGRQIDVRVSTLPTIRGEKVVLRILDSSSLKRSLDQMGYEPKCLDELKRAISASYGIVLVTGPTGSGKSTALYGAVREIMSVSENIVTVEDPVEYQLEGVNQVQVSVKRGMTFAAALRSILRQDPDIIMIGEIRDQETAEIAVKAAITGHLVLSTLHTNDAATAVTRLVDMKIDPFLVASSLILAAAQRLARRLCEKCKQPLDKLPSPESLLRQGFKEEELKNLVLYRPVGCNFCFGGYRGRFAVLETLEVDEKMRRLVIDGKSAVDIKEYALKEKGMVTLRRAAILNAIRGLTSLEEVFNVSMPDV